MIVGGDGQSYGGPPPGFASWRERMLAELKRQLDLSRVHFLGRIPYPDFICLMQVSRVHAYLTYPFVLSWSLLEAMSAGALVVGSRTAPVEEVITIGENGLLVDFFDVPRWAEAISEALANPARARRLREHARITAAAGYDLIGRCLPAQISMIEAG